MPTTQFVTVDTELSGILCQNVFAYYASTITGSPAVQEEMLEWFRDTIIPLWQAWTPSIMEFTGISVRSSNYPVPTSEALVLTGDTSITAAATMPPWLPLYVRCSVGVNWNGADGLPYTGMRPVRGGGHYFSGCPEAWNTATGYDNPGDTPGLAFNAFLAALNDDPVILGNTFTAVVWGDAMGASGSKPARDVVVAPIITATPRQFTRLASRKS